MPAVVDPCTASLHSCGVSTCTLAETGYDDAYTERRCAPADIRVMSAQPYCEHADHSGKTRDVRSRTHKAACDPKAVTVEEKDTHCG